MKKLTSILTISFLFLSGCAMTEHKEKQKLLSIITDYTAAYKKLDAYYAPYFNVEEDLNQFGDYLSPEYYARAKNIRKVALDKINSVDTTHLKSKEQLLHKMFKHDLEVGLEYFKHDFKYLDSFHQMGNRLREYLDDSSPLLTSFPFDNTKHYMDFVQRAEGFPNFIERQIATLSEGIQKGYTLNCTVAKSAIKTYEEALNPLVEKHPFFRPISVIPKSISEADQRKIRLAFHKMITENILPAFQKFDSFYKNTYIPKCRKSYGLVALAKGDKMYSHKIRRHTDLDLDAPTIHETGLKEVARIKSEFEKIMQKRQFKGNFRAFLRSLVEDEQYYFTSAKDMFAAFTKYKFIVDKKIPQYFKLIPKSDFQLVESENSEDAAASYRMPTDFLPYGRFVVNTKNLKGVPTYGVETLYLHEAIPGHHFQLAIQYERKKELTEYQRKILDSTAFVEGWALYAEKLGRDEGWISDDLQMLGSLSDEMLRAVRLVVDTGIHHFGWSRPQAIRYMQDHLAADIRDIEIEADRYSVIAGQALAYKTGQLKIIELREWAEQKLGPQFDIQDFHTVVLENGTVSLPALETAIDSWVQAQSD